MLDSLWLIHPDESMCDAFRRRFADLPNVRVLQKRYEELEPHDCFVTAANSYSIMTTGIDAAVVHFFGEAFATAHRLDWNWVADRQKVICYDSGRQVL